MNAHQRRVSRRKEERDLEVMKQKQEKFWEENPDLLDSDDVELVFDKLLLATHSK